MRWFDPPANRFGPRLTRGGVYVRLRAADLAASLSRGEIKPEIVSIVVEMPAPWFPPAFITPYERTVVWLRSLFEFSRRDGMWTLAFGPFTISFGDTPFRRSRRYARLMAMRPPKGSGLADTIAWHRYRMELGERRIEP